MVGLLPPFTVTLLCYIGLYSLVAVGLVMLTGVGGMTSFGQAAFVGTGAYATAWICTAPEDGRGGCPSCPRGCTRGSGWCWGWLMRR